MLDKYESQDDRNQHLLRPWVVACEAALILKDNAEKVRAMNPVSRLQHIHAVEQVGAEVPVFIKAAVAASCVDEKFEMLLKANSTLEVTTAISHILQALMPFHTNAVRTEAKINQVAEKTDKLQETTPAWTWENPSFYALASSVTENHERELVMGNVEDAAASKKKMAADVEAMCILIVPCFLFAVAVSAWRCGTCSTAGRIEFFFSSLLPHH